MKLMKIYLVAVGLAFTSIVMAKSVNNAEVVLKDKQYSLRINTANLLVGFTDHQGKVVVPMADTTSLYLNDSPIVKSEINHKSKNAILLNVVNAKDESATVNISFANGISTVIVEPANGNINRVSLRFGGMPVAHGLGDAGAFDGNFNLVKAKKSVFNMENSGGAKRWLSTFVVFPGNNFAGVFFDRGKKSVTLNKDKYQLNTEIKGKSTFYFFLGDNKEIYANYKTVRNRVGFEDIKPKSVLFELGWESWDALGWNTNQSTVKEVLSKFHKNGYPIRWAVTGSGFWEEGGTTTSFGKWGAKFSDPKQFKAWMNDNNIKWLIGIRTNFVPDGGPFIPVSKKRNLNLKTNSYDGNPLSNEGLKKDYFLKNSDGSYVQVTSPNFPQVPCYMLDGNQPGAALWYQQLYTLWNVDGIKEDTMMPVDFETSIYTKPISEIAKNGGLVMARNGEFVSPGTLLRINDTHVSQMQERIPNNYLQYAASGAPNVYSDVVGVFNMKKPDQVDANIRHSWLLAITAGMAVGVYPDSWAEDKRAIFKKTVDFHCSLVPYLYSAAMKSYVTGYPYTLTPLSIAYSNDRAAVHFEDYQWLIGESILATPLLKNYKEGKRDVYLPEGVWYDWETGAKFIGPTTLKDQMMPLQNPPCFVGGKGIVILRKANSEDLICRVYNVGKKAEADFYTLNDGVKYSIRVRRHKSTNSKVVNTSTKTAIQYTQGNNYIEFPITEGQNYDVF